MTMSDMEPIGGAPVRLRIPVCRAQPHHLELRSGGGADMPVMSGHFSTFGDWYEINSSIEGQFLERVAPGAFKKTFTDDASRKNPGDRIKVLLEHGYDPQVGDKPLGVPRSLSEDGSGPSYEVPLLRTSYVMDLIPALEAGAYGSSFRFQVMQDDWVQTPSRSTSNPGGIPERTIKEVRVMEFGPTMFPANASATAGLRSTTDEYYENMRSRRPEAFEEALRSVRSQRGFPPGKAPDTAPSGPKMPPLDNADQAKAAWAWINDPDTVKQLDTDDLAEMKDAITAACKKFGVDTSGKGAAPKGAPAKGTPPKGTYPKDQKTSTPSTGAARTATMTAQGNEGTVPTDIEFNMTVDERRTRQSEIRTRLSELDTEFSGGVMPEDQQTEWDSISSEYDGHTVAINAAEARALRIQALSGDIRSTESGTPFYAPNQVRTRSDIYDLAGIRKEARSMEDLGRLLKENALRAVEQSHFPSVDRQSAQSNIERLIRNVDDPEGTLSRRILSTGHERYDRAFGRAVMSASTAALTNEERAALAVGADATGNFAVPFQLDPTVIMTNAGVVNPIRQLARVVTITGKTWEGITSAGITVSRALEAAEASDNSPTLAQPTATPTRVQGFVPFSFEVDQDWTAMRGELGMMFEQAKETEESTSFVTGVGTTVYPQGVVTGAATGTLISTATTLVFVVGDLYALHDSLAPRHQPNASFLAHKATYSKIRQFDTAGGANLWERLGAGMPNQLLGYPAFEASAMSSALTSASKIILFGDFQKFLIVDKLGMNVELIPHLFGTGSNYPTGQRGMFAVWRNTSKILDADAIKLLKVL